MRRPARARRPPPPLSPALRRLVERAYRSRHRQVREIVARCRRTYPHYAGLSGPALESLRQNVRYLVGGFYRRGLMAGRTVTAEELAPTIRMAQLRVAQGVPLDEMIGCYQLALVMLWEELIEATGGNSAIGLELLRRLSISLSSHLRVITAVTEAYVEERERLSRSRGQAVDELMEMLLDEDLAIGVVEARARTLGLRLDTPRVAVLFRPVAPLAARPPESDELRRLLGAPAQWGDIVVGRVEGGVLALLDTRAEEKSALAEIAARLPEGDWRTGVGCPGTDATGFRRSAREARRAVELGAQFQPETRLHRYPDLALLDLVDVGSSRAEEFARQVLGPLARARAGETYRRTLRAVCQHGFHMKVAAAALGIHPNTMSYRLGQIRRRFGIDLDDAETRLRLQLALLIADAAA